MYFESSFFVHTFFVLLESTQTNSACIFSVSWRYHDVDTSIHECIINLRACDVMFDSSH